MKPSSFVVVRDIVKSKTEHDRQFWSGRRWVSEYPDACIYTGPRGCSTAKDTAKNLGATVYGDYGLESEVSVSYTPTVETKLVFTEYAIAALLNNAFEGGSASWCKVVGYTEPQKYHPILFADDVLQGKPIDPEVGKYDEYPLLPGGAVKIVDTESDSDDERVLDRDGIQRGLALLFTPEYVHHGADWLKGNDDATTGDVFLQLCVFGELVYV